MSIGSIFRSFLNRFSGWLKIFLSGGIDFLVRKPNEKPVKNQNENPVEKPVETELKPIFISSDFDPELLTDSYDDANVKDDGISNWESEGGNGHRVPFIKFKNGTATFKNTGENNEEDSI